MPHSRLRTWRLAAVGLLVALIPAVFATSASASVWSPPVSVDGVQYINGISCTSPTFCVGVDNGGKAIYYNSGVWTGPTAIAGAAATIYQVSCLSLTFCMAVDASGNVLQYSGGTTWAKTSPDAGTALKAVSCFSTSFCMAVDGAGKAFIYNGTTWTSQGNIDAGRAFYAISCPSATFCAAVDGSGFQVTYTGAWAAPALIDGGGGGFNSVSCLTSTSCVAGDGNGNVLTLTGTTWSGPAAIDAGKQIEWATCPSASFCVAVDSSGRWLSDNSGTWSGASTIDGTNAFVDVSCPTAAFCVAVDSVGNAVLYGAVVTSNQAVTVNETAGSLSVTAPAGFAFAALVPGTTVGPTNLGLMTFTDTLNNGASWNVSASATDLYKGACGAGTLGAAFTAITFTPGNQFQPQAGAVGTPVAGVASGSPSGADASPGCTIAPVGVSLVGSTATTVQGTWDEAPVADACPVTTGVTTATAGCNQITAIIRGTATAGAYSMTVQYTITG